MSQTESTLEHKPRSNVIRFLLILIFAAAAAFLAVKNFDKLGYVLLVLLGFGGVILVHEFGHFIVAKLCDIQVDAFSIGFPPVLLGVLRTEEGFRIRILPTLLPKKSNGGQEDKDGQGDSPDDSEQGEQLGALCTTIPWKGKAGETEYRLGLIPFGGFVKMLGQEDAGVAEKTDDPRSFLNKPLWQRISVVLAGVTFNVISALLIFIIIFSRGIYLQAPVIGGVVPASPAYQAGLEPGDRILSIDGKTFIDFSNVMLKAALGGEDETVQMQIERKLPDGSHGIFDISMQSRHPAGNTDKLRAFGISPVPSLEIDPRLRDDTAEILMERTGLAPGDRIVMVDGRPVSSWIDFNRTVENIFSPQVELIVHRKLEGEQQWRELATDVQLGLTVAEVDFDGATTLNSVHSMVPLLEIISVEERQKNNWLSRAVQRLQSLFVAEELDELERGDIILQIEDVERPVFADLREVMRRYSRARIEGEADRFVNVRVLRGQQELQLRLKPVRIDDGWLLGIAAALSGRLPVVARTIDMDGGPEALEIPAGATVTAVNGRAVESFYDIINSIKSGPGQTIPLQWNRGDDSGEVALHIPDGGGDVTTSSYVLDVPFAVKQELYVADNLGQAISMGYDRTVLFFSQAYITITRLFSRSIGGDQLSGPVGIIGATYAIAARQPWADFFYWIALISAMIAAFNLLPLPILDGGMIVLMVVAKIKGSPISERTQAALAYIGVAAIVALLLYVTYNDLVRIFTS